MSQPEIVQADLAGEDVVARVDLGGEDELFVTPTRTLLYRAEGLLSDESVDEYAHEAERITVSEGRRKAKITLDYGLDGQQTLSLPAKRLERAIRPILEGVLHANDVLGPEESIERLFRFSELTIVVAGERVVRHIGANLWDEDFESYHYSDISDLDFEDGSVATSVVLTVDGRQERFKAPNEDARAVRAALETTLLSYWGVETVEDLRAAAAPDDEAVDAEDGPASREEVSFGDGPDPLIADPAEPDELPENATRDTESRSAPETPDERSTPTAGQDRPTAEAAADEPSPDALAQQVERPPASESATDSTRREDAETTDAEPVADVGTAGSGTATDTEADAGSDSDESPTGRTDADAAPAPDEVTWAEATREAEPRGNPETGAAHPDADYGGRDDLVRGGPASEDAEPKATAPADATHADGPASNAGERTPAPTPPEPGFEGSGFESATPAVDEQVREELAALRETVERQNAELRAQRELVEQLIEELRRGR
ncbi:DUF7115 domain-containing protein [Halobellus sp. GM3]|uniref:DUF7115 domain-containing protein n=1 Tax=Halobellus sp. GM3 TaxID=3458410 RepID=UPI00403E0CE3